MTKPDRAAQLALMQREAPTWHLRCIVTRERLIEAAVADSERYFINAIADPVVEVLRTRFRSYLRRDPGLIYFATVNDAAMIAESHHPETDGSGRVVISDGLISVCNHLSEINALWLRFQRTLQMTLVSDEDALDCYQRSGEACSTLVCARFKVIHHRVFGSSAELRPRLSRDERRMARALALAALTFVMAHEASHFALGHNDDVSVGRGVRAEQEREADALATAVSCLALHGRFGDNAEMMALAGARLALSAISLWERGCFIQTASDRPSFQERDAALLARFDGESRSGAVIALGAALAVEHGEDVFQSLPDEVWNRGLDRKRLFLWKERIKYANTIRQFDILHGKASAELLDGLARAADLMGLQLGSALSRLGGTDRGAALESLGIDPVPFGDPASAIVFTQLQLEIEKSPVFAPCSESEKVMLVLTIALVIQRSFYPRPAFHI